jgi:transposase InsO family protein
VNFNSTELINHQGPWQHLEAVEDATLEWANWFNHRRLLQPIGDVRPAGFEQAYDNQLAGQARTA